MAAGQYQSSGIRRKDIPPWIPGEIGRKRQRFYNPREWRGDGRPLLLILLFHLFGGILARLESVLLLHSALLNTFHVLPHRRQSLPVLE
jgi:hypothetical protein